MTYREEVQLKYGFVVPDNKVLWDVENSWGYITPKGVVVGYNRCTETFWRNVHKEEDAKV